MRKGPQHETDLPSFPRPTNARELAFVVLHDHKQTSTFVSRLLTGHFLPKANATVTALDRQLATELAFGVVRRQTTLNALIQPHIQRPRQNVEGALWTLLQLGVYQLVFLSSVPTHAAVNETVELANWLRMPRWSGFLNGVLRSVSRSVMDDFIEEPAADAVPVSDGRYRKLRQPIFAKPQTNFCDYVARAFSFPRWLIERWQQRFGPDELLRLGFWFNAPANICLRVNSLLTDRDAVLSAFARMNIEAWPGQHPESVWLASPVWVEDLPGFQEGQFLVQDESAMSAGFLLAPQPGETVLDLCAAPGTKTTHIAELMQNRGTIIAADVRRDRLALIEASCRRLKIDIVETRLISADTSDVPLGPFNAALVDAPCSNTGVLGKRPEARWRINPHDLDELATLQKKLLRAAIERLQPTGRIVYSTCSIEPEENQNIVRTVLAEHPDVRLVEKIKHIPGHSADGGYQELIRRK